MRGKGAAKVPMAGAADSCRKEAVSRDEGRNPSSKGNCRRRAKTGVMLGTERRTTGRIYDRQKLRQGPLAMRLLLCLGQGMQSTSHAGGNSNTFSSLFLSFVFPNRNCSQIAEL